MPKRLLKVTALEKVLNVLKCGDEGLLFPVWCTCHVLPIFS